VCCGCGVYFCASVRFCSFFFLFFPKVLYLDLISLWSFSSTVCCMYGYQLPQVLARVICRGYTCRLICCFLEYMYLISSLIFIVDSFI